MIETARRLLDQKVGSIGVWMALGALSILASLTTVSGQPASFLVTIAMFVIAGGVVSRDAASGALQMILTRPIRRAEYLLGRYLGVLVMLAGFLAATVAVGFLLFQVATRIGWSQGSAIAVFEWGAVLRATAQNFLQGALTAAMLLFFSTFLRGIGDILAYILCGLTLNLLPALAEGLHRPKLAEFGRALLANVAPDVAWSEIFNGGRFLQAATGQYFLALFGYLVLAILIFNRREFSYGAE